MEAEMNESVPRDRTGKRRCRYRYTSHQVRVLNENFIKSDGYLPRDIMMHTAADLGLTYDRVAIWFQNRRARLRKGQLNCDADPSSKLFQPINNSFHSKSNTFGSHNLYTRLALGALQAGTPDCIDKPIAEHLLLNQRENVKSVLHELEISEQKDEVEISENTEPSVSTQSSQTHKHTTSEDISGEIQDSEQAHKNQWKKRRISAPIDSIKEKKLDDTNLEKQPRKRRRRTHRSLSLPFTLPTPSVQESEPRILRIVPEMSLQLPNISSKDDFHSTEPPLMSNTESNPSEPGMPNISSCDVSQSVMISNAGSNLASVMSRTSPTQEHQSQVSSISSDIPFQSIMSKTASNPAPLLSNTASYEDRILCETPTISSDPSKPMLLLPARNHAPIVSGTESDHEHRYETSLPYSTYHFKAGMLLTDSNQAPVMSTRLANHEHESCIPFVSSDQAQHLDMSTLPSNHQQKTDMSNPSTKDSIMNSKLPTITQKPLEIMSSSGSGSPEEGQCDLVISQVYSLVDSSSWNSLSRNLQDSMQDITNDGDQKCEQSLDQDSNVEDPVTVSNICNDISTRSRHCINLPDDVMVMYSSYRDYQEVESCNDNDNNDNHDETTDSAADVGMDYQTNADEKCIRLPWAYST